MPRRARTTLQRAALFEKHGGICHICGQKIDSTREPWDLDHQVPYALTNDDTDENLRPAHDRCHRGVGSKTSDDVKVIAKAKRVAAKHMGARAPAKHKLPGSKDSKWKMKVGGGRELRNPSQEE